MPIVTYEGKKINLEDYEEVHSYNEDGSYTIVSYKDTEYESKYKVWFNEEGECHREDGPALIDYDCSEYWYINGTLHRIDGPAVINKFDYFTEWWFNGKKHRIDGPAFISQVDGIDQSIDKEWWIDDIEYEYDEWIDKLVELGYKTKNQVLLLKALNMYK